MPAEDKVKQVSSVPYDVVYESEVHDYITENPLSFLRITRPEEEARAAGVSNAVMAKRNLQDFTDRGILVPDNAPAYYVYRLTASDHTQTGIVACCTIDEYDNGTIKKHEKTRPDKVADRTRHILEVRAQTGLIFLAYRGTDAINAMVEQVTASAPLYDFVSADGVEQTVWRA